MTDATYDSDNPQRLLWLNEHTAESVLEAIAENITVLVQPIGSGQFAWFVKVRDILMYSGKSGSQMVAEFEATGKAQEAAIWLVAKNALEVLGMP